MTQIAIISGVYADTTADFRVSYPVKFDTNAHYATLLRLVKSVGARAMEVTQSLVVELIDYNPETGAMLWKRRDVGRFPDERAAKVWNTRYSGKPCGVKSQGYFLVSVFKKRVLAHRLVWLFVHGEWPKHDIDHINGDRADNRLANLRAVTRAENLKNRAVGRGNKSGTMGVDWFSPAKLWRARVYDNGKEISLGYFQTKELAVQARLEAEADYGYHVNHGKR